MDKILFESIVYESVDDKSLSWDISKKLHGKQNSMQQRVNQNLTSDLHGRNPDNPENPKNIKS